MSYPVNTKYLLAKWLAGELSKDEKETFEKSEDFLAYNDIIKGIEYFDKPTFDIEKCFSAQKKYNKTYKEPIKTKVITLRTWLYSAAAIVIILFGLKGFLFSATTLHSTTIGETKTWDLPDNSVITLNADSSVNYNSDSFINDRLIELNGEAFFDVAKGSNFTVKTKNGQIVVLGTKFNVYSRAKKLEVHCFEGKVQVENQRNTIVLTPEKFTISDLNETLLAFDSTELNPDWIQGKSSFKNSSLQYIIEELERQYPIKINAEDIDSKRLFTGFFVHNNLEAALQTSFDPMNISYTFINERNIELKDK